MANSKSWQDIFYSIEGDKHDFSKAPLYVTAEQIKLACHNFKKTSEKEVRILCKQDKREDRPDIFIEKELFLLPVNNGRYAIIKGEGYVDIPNIDNETLVYESKLPFELETSKIGDSEMQHLDFAYASSLIRTFMQDETLVLTIRGRKYTPEFKFQVGSQEVSVNSVQTEVDAGYEGRDKIVLIEAKNSTTKNTIIRQLYYPMRQWQQISKKKVITLFFEKSKNKNSYSIWRFEFENSNDYNSIKLTECKKYRILPSEESLVG
jgi:hypothetical protein